MIPSGDQDVLHRGEGKLCLPGGGSYQYYHSLLIDVMFKISWGPRPHDPPHLNPQICNLMQ